MNAVPVIVADATCGATSTISAHSATTMTRHDLNTRSGYEWESKTRRERGETRYTRNDIGYMRNVTSARRAVDAAYSRPRRP